MESYTSETGWTYLPARPGRAALCFHWIITVDRDGPGRAVMWTDDAANQIVLEVDGPCHLVTAMLAHARTMQRSDRGD